MDKIKKKNNKTKGEIEMKKLELGQIVYGRMNSTYKVIDIHINETKNHINEKYTLKGQKIYDGFHTLWLVPSDINKLVFLEKRTGEQLERFLNSGADEF